MADQIKNAKLSGAAVEDRALIAGLHPIVVKLALSAVAWFLAVAWLDFAGDHELSLTLTLANGLFVVLFTLLLVAASMVIDDPRWNRPRARFAGFLRDEAPGDNATMRRSQVLTMPH